MKRILSVVAILMLAASLLPVKGQAGLRGAFDPITIGDNLIKAKFSPSLRGGNTRGPGSASSPKLENWIAFVAGSQVFGFESTGEIWAQVNIDQAFPREFFPVPLEVDPTAAVSYIGVRADGHLRVVCKHLRAAVRKYGGKPPGRRRTRR